MLNRTAKAVLTIAAVFGSSVASIAQWKAHDIYSDTADAHADIRAALDTASREHKRVILDFGGNNGGFLAGAGARIDHDDYWCMDIAQEALKDGRRRYPKAHFVR